MKMNKDELVKAISADLKANDVKLNQKEIGATVNAFTKVVVETLKEADSAVSLVGFGTFSSKLDEAKEGRNPATGETIQIPAKVRAKFNFGKTAKDEIAGA